MPTPPSAAANTHRRPPGGSLCGCKPWKRLYTRAEDAKRKLISEWEKDIHAYAQRAAEYESAIETLKEELKHTRAVQSTQRKLIEQLQGTLQSHGFTVKHNMASLSNCRADDHEICPLSLAPINTSPLPFSNDDAPCPLVINPVKPDHKCAQLACGHRFNAMWLIYHFIEGNTFRCPVCRAGESHFCFQRDELPPAVVRMLSMIDELKRKKRRTSGRKA
jgi:hypothetical protein